VQASLEAEKVQSTAARTKTTENERLLRAKAAEADKQVGVAMMMVMMSAERR